MYQNLKQLLDSRLGRLIVIDDFTFEDTYFIKVQPQHLHAATFFLKNDPDTRLVLLDQIFALPSNVLTWPKNTINNSAQIEILYHLQSLKLPYRVTLVVEAIAQEEPIPSLEALFLAARWHETDITKNFGIKFEQD